MQQKTIDISQGWLPITTAAVLAVAIASGTWWVAGEHAAIVAAQQEASAATAQAAQAEKTAQAAIDRSAAVEASAAVRAAEVMAKLAGISATLEGLRQNSLSIEAQVSELRAALLNRKERP